MSTDSRDPNDPENNPLPHENPGTRLVDLPIEDELKQSYLTYAMSVIVSRALAGRPRWSEAFAAPDSCRDERLEFGSCFKRELSVPRFRVTPAVTIIRMAKA